MKEKVSEASKTVSIRCPRFPEGEEIFLEVGRGLLTQEEISKGKIKYFNSIKKILGARGWTLDSSRASVES